MKSTPYNCHLLQLIFIFTTCSSEACRSIENVCNMLNYLCNKRINGVLVALNSNELDILIQNQNNCMQNVQNNWFWHIKPIAIMCACRCLIFKCKNKHYLTNTLFDFHLNGNEGSRTYCVIYCLYATITQLIIIIEKQNVEKVFAAATLLL